MFYNNLLTDLAFITNIRGAQLIIILLVVLLLFGTRRLPEMAKSIGKAIREFRKSASSVEKDFKDALDDESPKKPSENVAKTTPTTEKSPEEQKETAA